jgi:3-methyladenine DNA glycosylase AlkC
MTTPQFIKEIITKEELKVDELVMLFSFEQLNKILNDSIKFAGEKINDLGVVTERHTKLLIMEDIRNIIKNNDVILSAMRLNLEGYTFNLN